MSDLKKIEEFLVNTTDIVSLMELYATRIKSFPGNRAYYRALTLQCAEFLLAAKTLGDPIVKDSASTLHKMIRLLDQKNLTATSRQMELFIEELHDLISFEKHLFQEAEDGVTFVSTHASSLKSILRDLNREDTAPEDMTATAEQGIAADPFDDIEGLDDFVDSFLDDLDSAFDAITQPEAGSAEEAAAGQLGLTATEQSEVEKLFLSISGAYIQPVKDFISELSSGSVSKSWLDICLSSLRIIEDAGTKMSYEKITRILERFKKLMVQAKHSDTQLISREIRLQLLKEYANLSALMPEAFATSDDFASRGTRKDSVIINAILRKTSGIGPISRNKLIAAGMNTLDKYYMASADDLAAVSGLTTVQAEEVCRAFAEYREATRARTHIPSEAQVSITRLYKQLKQLKTIQAQYKEATRSALYTPEREGDRNRIRLKRQKTMWEINIILAELDSLQMVEDFRKMIYDRRIELLDEFMESATRKYF